MSDAVQLILRANKLMNVEQLELVRDMVAATRANALEEAAKVADAEVWDTGEFPNPYHAGWVDGSKQIAAAIRALVKEPRDE